MASGGLIVIGAAVIGAIAILLRAASVHFHPDDDEHDSDIEVATAETSGSHGGHSLEDSLTATITDNPSDGDIKVTTNSPLEQPHTAGKERRKSVKRGVTQCAHCGAANEKSNARCWRCGSSPKANLSADSLSSVNKRLREASADQSYVVEKDDEPKEHPVHSPAIPQDEEEDPYEEGQGTDEQDIRDDDISIFWTYYGRFLAWIDKWRTLTNTHMKSIMVVTSITIVVWGLSIIYGAVRFGHSGLVALIGASMFAVLSAGIATLFYLAPGKVKTVALAYPFGLNVVFLPPTVIALYEPHFSFILWQSTLFANFVATHILGPIGLEHFFRTTFDLEGEAYLIMWFAVAFPVGWILGTTRYLGGRTLDALQQSPEGEALDIPAEDPDGEPAEE